MIFRILFEDRVSTLGPHPAFLIDKFLLRFGSQIFTTEPAYIKVRPIFRPGGLKTDCLLLAAEDIGDGF